MQDRYSNNNLIDCSLHFQLLIVFFSNKNTKIPIPFMDNLKNNCILLLFSKLPFYEKQHYYAAKQNIYKQFALFNIFSAHPAKFLSNNQQC